MISNTNKYFYDEQSLYCEVLDLVKPKLKQIVRIYDLVPHFGLMIQNKNP